MEAITLKKAIKVLVFSTLGDYTDYSKVESFTAEDAKEVFELQKQYIDSKVDVIEVEVGNHTNYKNSTLNVLMNGNFSKTSLSINSIMGILERNLRSISELNSMADAFSTVLKITGNQKSKLYEVAEDHQEHGDYELFQEEMIAITGKTVEQNIIDMIDGIKFNREVFVSNNESQIIEEKSENDFWADPAVDYFDDCDLELDGYSKLDLQGYLYSQYFKNGERPKTDSQIIAKILQDLGDVATAKYVKNNGLVETILEFEVNSKKYAFNFDNQSVKQLVVNLLILKMYGEDDMLDTVQTNDEIITTESVKELLSTMASSPAEETIVASDWVEAVTGEANVDISPENRKTTLTHIKSKISNVVKAKEKEAVCQTSLNFDEIQFIETNAKLKCEEEVSLLDDLGFNTDNLINGISTADDVAKLDEIIKSLQSVKESLVAHQLVKSNETTKQVKGQAVLHPTVKKVIAPMRKESQKAIKNNQAIVNKAFTTLLSFKDNDKLKESKTKASQAIILNIKSLQDVFNFDSPIEFENLGTKSNKISMVQFADALSNLKTVINEKTK